MKGPVKTDGIWYLARFKQSHSVARCVHEKSHHGLTSPNERDLPLEIACVFCASLSVRDLQIAGFLDNNIDKIVRKINNMFTLVGDGVKQDNVVQVLKFEEAAKFFSLLSKSINEYNRHSHSA